MSIKKILAGLSLTVASAVASAAPWTQTIDFNPDILVPPTATWTHDLRTVGFDVGLDTITSFSLNVRIKDDGGFFDNLLDIEIAVVGVPGGGDIWSGAIGLNSYNGAQTGGVATLNDFGVFTVTLGSFPVIGGDFLIDSSTLTAQGRDGVAVPEPGALALVGLGLVGVALRRRQQRAA